MVDVPLTFRPHRSLRDLFTGTSYPSLFVDARETEYEEAIASVKRIFTETFGSILKQHTPCPDLDDLVDLEGSLRLHFQLRLDQEVDVMLERVKDIMALETTYDDEGGLGGTGYEKEIDSASDEFGELRHCTALSKKASTFTADQKARLEAFFEHIPKPTQAEKLVLSRQLEMTMRQLNCWFANRRSRPKKGKAKFAGEPNLPSSEKRRKAAQRSVSSSSSSSASSASSVDSTISYASTSSDLGVSSFAIPEPFRPFSTPLPFDAISPPSSVANSSHTEFYLPPPPPQSLDPSYLFHPSVLDTRPVTAPNFFFDQALSDSFLTLPLPPLAQEPSYHQAEVGAAGNDYYFTFNPATIDDLAIQPLGEEGLRFEEEWIGEMSMHSY